MENWNELSFAILRGEKVDSFSPGLEAWATFHKVRFLILRKDAQFPFLSPTTRALFHRARVRQAVKMKVSDQVIQKDILHGEVSGKPSIRMKGSLVYWTVELFKIKWYGNLLILIYFVWRRM